MQKLEEEFKKNGGKFRKIRVGELFDIKPTSNYGLTNEKLFNTEGDTPVVVNSSLANGIGGYVDREPLEKGGMITFSDTTTSDSIFYQPDDFIGYSHVQGMYPYDENSWSEKSLLYFCSIFRKSTRGRFDYGNKFNRDKAKEVEVEIPFTNDKINFSYMEKFIEELEALRIEELEAYLRVTGLKDYKLNEKDQKALDEYYDLLYNSADRQTDRQTDRLSEKVSLYWQEYNLKDLFGESTRGRRLKSTDRIKGSLPFVTAGEADTGISDYVSNAHEIFQANTITIDMFGSAKYRIYPYGADDHVAVVHTEKLNKYAVIFITSAIHKVSNAGQFDYSRNFYAKDADELNITLPSINGKPAYAFMEDFIETIHKIVIKDVVIWADKKIEATRQVVEK